MRILVFLLCFLSFLNSQVMLLGEYSGENLTGWVMSEKYDGVRAIWDGKRLLSRSGKIINAPKWWLANFPDFSIDGELWSARGEFEKITSIVNDLHPSDEWIKIKFMIFDLPDQNGDLFDRLGVLDRFLKNNPNKNIKIIEQIPISSNEAAFKFLDEVTSGGGEGIVVRNPKSKYESGRSKNILKLKKFKDAECMVVGINGGKGKFSGKMGSITCESLTDKIRFKIGSGFSDKERENPPKIGTIITYKFQNYTKNGKPRFPVFLRIFKAVDEK